MTDDEFQEALRELEDIRQSILSYDPWYAVTGWGAVSPAGWSAGALRDAVRDRLDLPVKKERRCEGAPERHFRPVPPHPSPPEWMKQPRFRRTTTIGRYAVHAATEALGEARLAAVQQGDLRVGVVFCTMNGCVQFSRRFYTEVEKNPSLASPILFPETVYNAPSSHLAALLGSGEINYTLIGDSAQFIAGLGLATQWLADGMVDACLVVAAEELDWLTDEALALFDGHSVAAEGAAAVLLEPRSQQNDAAPLLQQITSVSTYGAHVSRANAAESVSTCLGSAGEGAVLFDGLGASRRTDKAERFAWQLWQGPRVSVRRTLGEGFAVTSGWQSIAALEWLRDRRARQALVSAVGLSQQAVGAFFGFEKLVGVTSKVMHKPQELRERAGRSAAAMR
jgi:3-oxoacyl-(acyl-carrier-protein) synthase